MRPSERHVRLFRNGRNQTLWIPREFELPGNEVTVLKDGDRLIVQPLHRASGLADLLAAWTPLEEVFPDVDVDLKPLDNVKM